MFLSSIPFKFTLEFPSLENNWLDEPAHQIKYYDEHEKHNAKHSTQAFHLTYHFGWTFDGSTEICAIAFHHYYYHSLYFGELHIQNVNPKRSQLNMAFGGKATQINSGSFWEPQ